MSDVETWLPLLEDTGRLSGSTVGVNTWTAPVSEHKPQAATGPSIHSSQDRTSRPVHSQPVTQVQVITITTTLISVTVGLMEWLTVLVTAHLSAKKPHGTNKDPKPWDQLLNGLGSAVITEVFNYAIHQEITRGSDRRQCRNAQITAPPKNSCYNNINAIHQHTNI